MSTFLRGSIRLLAADLVRWKAGNRFSLQEEGSIAVDGVLETNLPMQALPGSSWRYLLGRGGN